MMWHPDILVLVKLLAAHVLADFFLQPQHWITSRCTRGIRSLHLYYHAAVVGVVTYLLLQQWNNFWLPGSIMIAHLLIDTWKSYRPRTIRYFLIDQAAHLATIGLAWLWFTGFARPVIVQMGGWLDKPAVWFVGVGLLLVLRPAGFLVAQLTDPWQQQIEEEEEGLEGLQNAGMWIGMLERVLIFIFILVDQFGAIGFLIFAKSVFRFSGRIGSRRRRKETEYILIGTLLSFAIAILVGLAVRALI